MLTIKKVWLTQQSEADLASLSIESLYPEQEYKRVKADEMVFPTNPTIANPMRHTMVLGLFDDEDLVKIVLAIQDYLAGR